MSIALPPKQRDNLNQLRRQARTQGGEDYISARLPARACIGGLRPAHTSGSISSSVKMAPVMVNLSLSINTE